MNEMEIGGKTMSEVIVITSGKGGVGKTTATANIGMGLARMKKKTVVIDTDIGLRNLDVVLGLENRIVYNMVDVIEGNCRLKQALIKDKRCPELSLLPSAQTRDKSAVTPEQMIKLTEELKEHFDYVLLDCPAGIEQGFKNAIAGAERAIVVTTPEQFRMMRKWSFRQIRENLWQETIRRQVRLSSMYAAGYSVKKCRFWNLNRQRAFSQKYPACFTEADSGGFYEKIQFHAQGSILQCCKRQTVNRASGRQTELYTGDGGTDETGDFIRYGKISGN